MAEEPEEPSDGITQPSREKPQWVRLRRLLPGFLLLVVGSLPWLSTVLPQWGTMLRQRGTILWQWCLGSWQWVLFLLLRLSGFLLLLKVVWPWLSTVLPQWGKKLSQKRKAAGRWCKEWMGGLPLFAAIAIWAVLGIIAFLLAMWWLGRVPFWQLKLDPEKQAENIVKIALTLVGGVGAVAYLVIKYQERQQAGRAEKREKDRTVDTKVQDAINQLGSDKASTRIAGVYALTDIADRYKDSYRQRVVDILCGYLRSDRANYALDELGQPVKNASGHLVKSGASDEAVESTILSVMRDRLRKERKDDKTEKTIVRQTVDDDQLWCACTFDLHGATFHEAVDLTYSTFERDAAFYGTKFERNADFRGAHFTGDVDFRGATFAGGAYFDGATFAGGADFGWAHFTGDADFDEATFTRGAYFYGADFTGGADFGGATFTGEAHFRGADFAGGADFGGATFADGAYFYGATFTRGAHFGGATFTGDAHFGGADFADDADFGGATFTRGAYFGDAYFADDAHFAGYAYFAGASFTRGADFSGAEFRASAVFSGIQGQPSFRFEECKFNKIFRGAYEWGPIPIPEDNDGLPAGAVWKDFLEEALKDKDFLELWRNLNKCLKEYGKDGGTTNR